MTELLPPQESPFELWLQLHHFGPVTVRKTLADVARARARWIAHLELRTRGCQPSLRRYATFLTRTQEPRGTFELAVLAAVAPSQRMPRAPRKDNHTRSFGVLEWGKILHTLAGRDEPEACVLFVQAVTGRRIRDVLVLTQPEVLAAMTELPRYQTMLATLWPARARQFANWVCPQRDLVGDLGMRAYQRVRRYLQALAHELKIDGRVHTQRFRRTVGVRTLEETRDIAAATERLGHRSRSATSHYLTELHAQNAEQLQQKLRKHHGHEES